MNKTEKAVMEERLRLCAILRARAEEFYESCEEPEMRLDDRSTRLPDEVRENLWWHLTIDRWIAGYLMWIADRFEKGEI